MDLVILIGLQASGKSAFRRERFDATHVVVSKDLLRNNRRPARRQMALIEEALKAGRSVVVDNTNPAEEDRADLIRLGRCFGARIIGYYLASTVQDCVRRNARRTGRDRVPDVAIFATATRLRQPALCEGFDELYRVTLQEEGPFTVRPLEELRRKV